MPSAPSPMCLTLPCLTLPRLTLPRLTLPRPPLPRLTLPRLTLPRQRLLLGALAAFGLWMGLAAPATAAPVETVRLSIADGQRVYHLHQPARLAPGARPPVVLVLHGGGRHSGALAIARRYDLNAWADRRGFLAIYPEGLNGEWNDGRGVSFRDSPGFGGIDDVGFLSAVIERAVTVHGGDPDRVWLIGASNGGMMALRLVCERPGRIAAVVALIATMPNNIEPRCAPGRPVPLMIVNGTDDPIIPYEGGHLEAFGSRYGLVLSTDRTAAIWCRLNGCRPDPDITVIDQVEDGTAVTVRRWQGEAPVVVVSIQGGGHAVPGFPQGTMEAAMVGRASQEVALDQLVWEFLSAHPLP